MAVLVLVVAVIGALGIAVANYAAKNRKTLSPSPAPTKTYSGILYKIEKRADGGAWFTVLVNEDKTVKRVEANISSFGLKVGDEVLLTMRTENTQEKVVDILKQSDPLLKTVEGKVISSSEKMMALDWHGNKIVVNIGGSVKFSYKYNEETNTPGKQTEIRDLSQIKVGDYVVVGIDRAASSESLVVSTIEVLNSP